MRLYLDAFHTQHRLHEHNRSVQTAVIENLKCKTFSPYLILQKNYNYLAIHEFVISIIRYNIISQIMGCGPLEGVAMYSKERFQFF